MTKLPKVDVVLVGAGLVGGAIANELAKSATNLRIVVLERGPFRPAGRAGRDFVEGHFDEWRYAVQGELFQDLSKVTVTFRDDRGHPALPMREYGSLLLGDGVGGAMIHWNGQSWRFLPDHFNYRTHLVARYGKGVLPPDTTIQDWPVTYDDLEPYYDRYEKTFGIAGKAGNIRGAIQPGGNPFEGPRAEEYPQAPGPVAYGPALFRDACEQLGYRPFPQPGGISPRPYTNPDGMTLGACQFCGFCDRFDCHLGAKATPTATVIRSALGTGRVEIRPHATACRVNHRDGMATGVSYFDAAGRKQEQPADLVIVGAFTLENIRLLLLSKIGEPYDPRSGKGVVGRNYAYQLFGASGLGAFAVGWYDDRILNRFMGAGTNGFAIDEFNADNFDHADLGFVGGGSIAINSVGARPILQSGPLPPGTPRWGSAWKAAVKRYYNRVVSFEMQGESPAYRQNHADLDPTYRDAWGNPLLRVTFNWTENERKLVKYVADQALTRIIAQMGPALRQVHDSITDYGIVPYQSTHATGGVVMGDDPTTSVVNRYCQVWDVPNLFVIGASAFPQNPGYNPTGTVGALAYQAADAIVNKYLPSPGPLA